MNELCLEPTPEERQLGEDVINLVFGFEFSLVFDDFPRAVGVKGDEKNLGKTACIIAGIDHPSRFLSENQELVARMSNFLCGKIPSLSRVVFEISKPNDTKHHET